MKNNNNKAKKRIRKQKNKEKRKTIRKREREKCKMSSCKNKKKTDIFRYEGQETAVENEEHKYRENDERSRNYIGEARFSSYGEGRRDSCDRNKRKK